MNEWHKFLAERTPSPVLVLEFLDSKPNNGWGEAIVWLLTEHEYKIAIMREALENQGLVRIDE